MTDKCASIGRYVVADELGRGSMGVVHRAHDPVMGRDVAIKTILLPHGLTQDRKDEFQQRFLREAQAAGRLSHPGIVTVFEFNEGPEEELPFIAMEYVPGPTLHELIAREGALAPHWALEMAETLADALMTAHDAGIIHRDLKPANVLIREADGSAKIADFGVARINVSDLTENQTTYGSPAYMAPERIRGEVADARSDLWSLAVMLFETLTGRRPFGGEDFESICFAILQQPPRLTAQLEMDLGPAFDRFFERALAKDPDQRFQNGASFCRALKALRAEHHGIRSGASTVQISTREGMAALQALPVEAKAPQRTLTLRIAAIGGAIVLILAALVLMMSLRGPAPADPLSTTPEANIETQPATSQPASDLAALHLQSPLDLSDPPDATTVIDPTYGEFSGVESAPQMTSPPSPAETPAAPAKKAATEKRAGSPSSRPEKKAAAASTPQKPPVETPPAEDAPEPETAGASVTPMAPAIAVAVTPEPAFLDLHVRNSFKSGKLTLMIDGDEIYSTELSSESRVWNRVYKKATRQAAEDTEARLEIPPGKHTIVAIAESEAKARTYQASLEIDVESGGSQPMFIAIGRTFGKRLVMTLE